MLNNVVYTGRVILKNTFYNLSGYIIPLLFAIALIPSIIKGLGDDKFGLLSLSWMLIGYFGILDFGIGRALTKIIAEKIGKNEQSEITLIFWTMLFFTVCISVLVSVCFIPVLPIVVNNFLNIPEALKNEALNSFYLLALSIPIITLTSTTRGVLEAYQKFGLINVIRIVLGLSTFLIPILCLILTNNLFWIILSLLFIRFLALIFYFKACLKINPNISQNILFNKSLIRPLIKLSGWMTVSNLVGPFITYIDRIFIGAFISTIAITYYSSSYEVITKLLLIPGAIVGVLFPTFSATYSVDKSRSKKLFNTGMKFTFLILYPIVFIVTVFAFEGIEFWLGTRYAEESSHVLQILSVGVMLNSISYFPFTLLQGIGRPDLVAKIHLIELPVYSLLIWYSATYFGIIGVAITWAIRTFFDLVFLIIITQKQTGWRLRFKINYSWYLYFILPLFIPIMFQFDFSIIKLLISVLILISFVIISWTYIILKEEKSIIKNFIPIINGKD